MIEAYVTHDESNGATYVGIQKGTDAVARSVEITGALVFVDLDKDGYVIGIEILGIGWPIATEEP